MERVYKSMMGYKPENEKNKATHIIVTLDEYNALQGDFERLKRELRNEKSSHEQDKEYFNIQLGDLKRQLDAKLAKLNEEAQEKIQEANFEVGRLEGLNKNLLRICTERANAKRGLKPKKEHDGYLLLESIEYEYRFVKQIRNRPKHLTLPSWKVKIQTPYDATLTLHQIEKMVHDDLINKFGAKIGLTNVMTDGALERHEPNEIQEIWNSSQRFIFKKIYKQNFKSGLWEVDYLVNKNILAAPDMVRK